MSTVKLPVTNSKPTLVDSDIVVKLKGKKLNLCSKNRYIRFSSNSKRILLHRFITDCPERMVVDHINGDTFDNRKANLRICNRSENRLNQRTPPRSLSGYRLVSKISNFERYQVRINIYYKQKYLFSAKSRHIAGIFADQVLVKVVGPFVKKNFPEKITSSCLSEFIGKTNGRIFRVVFSRRSDGVQREMVCRTGVHSKHNGGTIPFDPSSRGLYSVYDVQKQKYRFIPLENVICIRFAKTNYRVVA